MSHEPKKSAPNEPKAFPVRSLIFIRPQHMPNGGVRGDLRGDNAQRNAARWVIEYIPSLRHHRVFCYAANRDEPDVRMVWEGHVASWEPM